MKVIKSRPNHPQSQGKVEVTHKAISKKINNDRLKHENDNWEQNIKSYENALNNDTKKNLVTKHQHKCT